MAVVNTVRIVCSDESTSPSSSAGPVPQASGAGGHIVASDEVPGPGSSAGTARNRLRWARLARDD